jgi:hypothetical protein
VARAVEAPPRRDAVRPASGGSRQAKVVITRVQPWSILKFSLVFYFCVMLIFVFSLLILYWLLGLIGVLGTVTKALPQAGFGSTKGGFKINGFWIFSRLFVVGVVGVVGWSIVNMFIAVLYNLVADVIGGVQITMSEQRR